jgi:GT2 family glycosyltransferase
MPVPSRPLLAVVPVSLTAPEQLDAATRCLVSLWATAREVPVLVLDHGPSDGQLTARLRLVVDELGMRLERWDGPGGRAAADNVGLQVALDAGADAVLVDPDTELSLGPWLPALRAREGEPGRPAGVVGGRLVTPQGTLHGAGYLFSRLSLAWHPRMAHAPADLPEALAACRCPVAGGLELVRHEAIAAAGLLDVRLPAPLDRIDLCLRAFGAGLDCLYEPAAAAVRLGAAPVADADGKAVFDVKWHGTDLSAFVPPIL